MMVSASTRDKASSTDICSIREALDSIATDVMSRTKRVKAVAEEPKKNFAVYKKQLENLKSKYSAADDGYDADMPDDGYDADTPDDGYDADMPDDDSQSVYRLK